MEHRRGSVGMALPAWRETRLPPYGRRLRRHRSRCRDGTQTHRPRSAAHGDYRRQHPCGRNLRSEDYVAAGCGMGCEATLYLLENAVSGSPAPTPGARMRRSFTPPNVMRKRVTPRSSGKGTRPGTTSATAISRSCTISTSSPPTASKRLLPLQGERRFCGLDSRRRHPPLSISSRISGRDLHRDRHTQCRQSH